MLNDRLIKALLRQPVDKTPVWIMRQAGRYLPEYREIRQRAGSFMALCQTPELASEVTLQPLRRFDLDAAILFSDILTIPDAMGLGLEFIEGEGPRLARPVRTREDIARLPIPDPNETLAYVLEAIVLTKAKLANTVPLIGFSGSPWTLAAYMIEGESSTTFMALRKFLYTEPDDLQALLDKLTHAVTAYLNAQIAAGVDVVMLFDTWGGLLTTEHYRRFSLRYCRQIIASLKSFQHQHKKCVPIILFTKGGGLWLEEMAQSGCDALGIDWTVDIGEAYRRVGSQVALQGNLDPAVLYGTPQMIRREVTALMARYGTHPGHIFNLGHGIEKDVPPEHVKILVDAVHLY